MREGTRFINEVEVSLMLADKLEALGREDEAQWPALLVPNQDQENRKVALRLLQWTLDRLRARGIENPGSNGAAVKRRRLPNSLRRQGAS
jgi:hypothetical protein